jgi:hypothetical protein
MRANGLLPGTVLVDGRVEAHWSIGRAAGTATLTVVPFRALTPAEATAVEDEGRALLAFAAAEADAHDVVVAPPDP